MNETNGAASAVLTVPNVISLGRILLTPVFVGLIVHHGTQEAGLLLFGAVAATDWVDGTIARRTGQVSDLGKVLDPAADRLAIAAGLVAMVVRGAFPLWIGVAILVRDGGILVAGAFLLARRHARIDVRFIGKAATAALMVAIPFVAWGNLHLPLATSFLAIGWPLLALGLAEYALATGVYVGDIRRALAGG